MFRRHFSDDILVSHLDGELPAAKDVKVRHHLGGCWRCRARALELRQEIERVSASFGDKSCPDAEWVASAKGRFAEWRRGFDADLAARAVKRERHRDWRMAPVAAAALTISVAIGWLAFRDRTPAAAVILVQSRAAERQSFGRPLEQVLHVETAELRPAGQMRSGRLTVWSDAPGGRFASRWVDSAGQLKYAVWQPGSGRELTYDPAVRTYASSRLIRAGVADSIGEVVLPGPDLNQIESAFMQWLESRRWTPISLSDDFAVFSGRAGVTVSAERIRTRAGRVIRITAARQTAWGTVSVMLDVNAATYSALRLVARAEAGNRAAELRLSPERMRTVSAADLPNSIFEPAAHFTRAIPPRPPIPTAIKLSPEEHTAPPAVLDDLEMSAMFALHGMHACLGVPVEVVRESGALIVRGVAESPDERDRLLAGLSSLSGVGQVRFDIRTVMEEGGDAGTSKYNAVKNAQTVVPPAAASIEKLPIEDRLVEYFSENPESALDAGLGPDSEHAAVGLANQAVTISRTLKSDAWAIRKLAERYGGGRVAGLSERSRQRLQRMIRDHLGAIRTRMGSADRLMRPPLAGMFGSAAVRGSIPNVEGGWSAAALGLFASIDTIEDSTLWLFSAQTRGTQGHSSDTADAVARKLVLELSRVEEHVANLERALVSDFERETGRAAAHSSTIR